MHWSGDAGGEVSETSGIRKAGMITAVLVTISLLCSRCR